MKSFNSILQKFSASQTLAWAHLGLGKVYMGQNDLADARAKFALVTESQNRVAAAEAHYLIGETFRQDNDDARAVTEYLKVKDLYAIYSQWVVPAILQAAQANVRLGRFAEARNLYRFIVDNYPFETEAVNKANQNLQALAGK